jgi:hypothetical protein
MRKIEDQENGLGILPVKFIWTKKSQPIASIMDSIGWDNMLVVMLDSSDSADNESDINLIDEKQIMEHVLEFGLVGEIGDLLYC